MAVSTSYDGYGRLLTYARTGDAAQSNAYNGLDDRVSVTSGSTTNAFVYDSDGRLLGEYDASGAPVAETIWLSPDVSNHEQPFSGDDGVGGYAPLAVVAGSGSNAATYWVHGNHLGVPLVVTDSTGAVATPPAYTMAGYPGQTKTLSDIYYNRYRDYDSTLGRYIQADPIGLGGGSNPYVYANDNPLRWTDPRGQNPGALVIPLIEGAGAGAGEGGVAAACLSNPVGWVVCGGAAIGAAGYGAYKLYQWWKKPCDDGSVLQMAKGGKQNKENEWSRAARLQPDPCDWLKKMYDDPNTSSADRDKIYTAQKVLGCRWSSMNANGDEMTWYAAHIIIGFIKEAHTGSISVWENVILIEASSDEDAQIEAEKIGKDEEAINDGLTVDGIPARRVFAGVRKIVKISNPEPPQDDARPISGTEITYSELEVKDLDDLRRLGVGESVSIIYYE